ncbi:MAG: hypothetical protein DI546_23920 [Rhizobium sp.]|nr:MAG: hypothetical protein DI546_23920 [Rhizobium sp.]
MFGPGTDLRANLHQEPVEFRAGINSLVVPMQDVMEMDRLPIIRAFSNRQRDRLKLLFFERCCIATDAMVVQPATAVDAHRKSQTSRCSPTSLSEASTLAFACLFSSAHLFQKRVSRNGTRLPCVGFLHIFSVGFL